MLIPLNLSPVVQCLLRMAVTHISFLSIVLSWDSEEPVGVNESTSLGENAIKKKLKKIQNIIFSG